MKKLIPLFLVILLAVSACKDACKDISCVHGNCNDGTCVCADGYEGATCDTEINDRFEGTWAMPCDGSMNIPLLGGNQTIPTQNTEIVVEDNGTPSTVVINFTIPFINETIVLVGTVDGNVVNFDDLDYTIPASTIDSLSGGAFALPVTVTVGGTGTLENEQLLIDLDVLLGGGSLGTGTINCVGTKVE